MLSGGFLAIYEVVELVDIANGRKGHCFEKLLD